MIEPLPIEAARLALETIRISGMVVATPLPFTHAPARVRAALVVLLGLVCHPTLAPSALPLDSVEQLGIAAPGEFLLGVGMGFVVRIVLASAEIAGELAGPMLGLGAASLFDPHAHTNESALTNILRHLTLVLALLLGIHRVLIGSLMASFRVVPLGAFIQPGLAAPVLIRLSAGAIASGLRLSLPLVAALLLIQLGLAFVSRAAPSLQIFSVGFAVSLVAGTVVFVGSMPELAREIEVLLGGVGEQLELVVGAMAGAP